MSLTLQPASVPADTTTPSTLSAWLDFITQFMRIAGSEDLTGVVIGASTPTIAQQGLLWAKTASGRFISVNAYNGEWLPMPAIARPVTSATITAIPQAGEVVVRTDRGYAVEAYIGGVWTTVRPGRGATADRPTGVPDGYVFHDTTIDRPLRWNESNSGWTTVDGCVGEMRMTYGVSESETLARNPGWSVVSATAGGFPRGADGTAGTGVASGRGTFNITVTRGTDAPDNNTGANYVTQVAVDGTSPTAPGTASMPGTATSVDVPINPLAFGVIFIKKDY